MQESGIKKWGTLVVLSLALAIIIIDTTLLNVSIGTIIRELHTDLESLQWVITAYSLMLAAFTITGGRLGDLFGRKRMFVIGAIIFACGSFLASISNQVSTLILGEAIIEGIGAALMMPATASLLISTFRGRERAVAFGVWGGIAAASSAIGPIVGGYLTTHHSWRWGFRINIFVVLALLVGSILIKEVRDKEERPSLDLIGVVLSALGLLSIVFGIISSAKYGWWTAKMPAVFFDTTIQFGELSIVPVAIGIGLFLLACFAVWEHYTELRGKTPLVSLAIFKNSQFVSGAMTTGMISLGQAGMFFALPIFLQAARGYDALHTGLAMLPLSLSVLIAAPFSAFISKFFAPKRLIQMGMLITIGAFFVLRSEIGMDSTAASLIPGLVLYGLGMGFVMAQINNLTLSAVSVQQAGEASGINNTLRQVGSTLGSAIIGAIVLSSMTTALVKNISESWIIPEPMKPMIVAAVSKQGSSIEFGGPLQVGTVPIEKPIRAEITRVSQEAMITSNRVSLVWGALFAFLGFLVSFRLPNTKHIEKGQSATAGH